MAASIARITTIILLGVVHALLIGFTLSGDLPVLLAIAVAAAVTIVGICGIFQTSSSNDPRD